MEMSNRQELKFLISTYDFLSLQKKLDKILKRDTHSINDFYRISSLYFDDIFNSAYHQKIDGYNQRSKFRIRYYDNNKKFFKLEKKMKFDNITHKESVTLSKIEVEEILNNQYDVIEQRPEEIIKELLFKLKGGLFKPKVIVEYLRLAYTYPIGNTRITFDKYVKGTFNKPDLFASNNLFFETIDSNFVVMEVKFNGQIPLFIKGLIQTSNVSQESVSKYVLSRKEIQI